MLLSTYIFIKSIVNKKWKAVFVSYIVWLLLLALYIWMDTNAQAFVRDPSMYYSVNDWQETLYLLMALVELPGVFLWGKVFFNTVK